MPSPEPADTRLPTVTEKKKHTHKKLSETLVEIAADSSSERLMIRDLMRELRDRAFGALLFIFAIPTVLPAPPGLSAVVGAPLIFLSLQLMLGRKAPWLPGIIADRSIARKDFAIIVAKALPWLQKIERLLKPRMGLCINPPFERVIGAVCFLLAAIVFLPIPLGNMLPSFAICLLSLAIIERDGLLSLIGLLTAVFSVVIVWAFLTALIKSVVYVVTKFLFT